MPRLINIGNYGTLQFDDNTPDEDIQSYIDDNYKEISNRLNSIKTIDCRIRFRCMLLQKFIKCQI